MTGSNVRNVHSIRPSLFLEVSGRKKLVTMILKQQKKNDSVKSMALVINPFITIITGLCCYVHYGLNDPITLLEFQMCLGMNGD